MTSRPHRASGLLAVVGFVILTLFQNCAPIPSNEASGSSDDQVTIVDRWGQEKISFPASLFWIPENVDSVHIDGLCGAGDQAFDINWSAGSAHQSGGRATCVNGKFRITLSELQSQLSSCRDSVVVEASSTRAPDDAVKTEVRKLCL
jgi:hypothetical protein